MGINVNKPPDYPKPEMDVPGDKCCKDSVASVPNNAIPVTTMMFGISVQFRGKYCWKCPQLLTRRFGQAYQCRLFASEFGSQFGEDLKMDPENDLILRHEQCFENERIVMR